MALLSGAIGVVALADANYHRRHFGHFRYLRYRFSLRLLPAFCCLTLMVIVFWTASFQLAHES